MRTQQELLHTIGGHIFKQQILAFVLRQGKKFEGGKTYWTIVHMKWLKSLDVQGVAKERLRRRFYKMTLNKGVNRNVATTAIARELACFMWGMATGNIS